MKIRFANAFGLLGCVFLLQACVTGSDGTGTQSTVIMPLSVGNYWEYADSNFSSTGVFSGVTTHRSSIRGEILIRYQDVSSEVFLAHKESQPDSVDWLVANEGDAQYTHGGKSGDSLFLHGKYLGESIEKGWSLPPYSESHGEFSFTAKSDTQPQVIPWTSTDSLFTTPAGAFHCHVQKVVIAIAGDTSSSTYYWVPNIGLVGSIFRNRGVITEKEVLSSYVAK